jgi:hypothetical protein
MGERTIYVTEFDRKRLSKLLNVSRSRNEKDSDYLTRLENELEWMQVVSPRYLLYFQRYRVRQNVPVPF